MRTTWADYLHKCNKNKVYSVLHPFCTQFTCLKTLADEACHIVITYDRRENESQHQIIPRKKECSTWLYCFKKSIGFLFMSWSSMTYHVVEDNAAPIKS